MVLADIFGAVHADDDGGSARRGSARLAQDFLFGLGPVIQVVAGDFSGADVDFFGAAADGLVPVRGRSWPGVGNSCGCVHEVMPPSCRQFDLFLHNIRVNRVCVGEHLIVRT